MKFILIGFRRHFVIWDQYTLWNGQLSFQQNTRFRCDVVARHRFPKRPLGSQVSFFFHNFRKKSKKVVQKAGTGWCLHLWLIDLKRGHFWSSFRIMRQTTKAHRACPPPQILLAKSDYFPEEQKKKNRISKVLVCQSQRKERFAQSILKLPKIENSNVWTNNVHTDVWIRKFNLSFVSQKQTCFSFLDSLECKWTLGHDWVVFFVRFAGFTHSSTVILIQTFGNGHPRRELFRCADIFRLTRLAKDFCLLCMTPKFPLQDVFPLFIP